MAKQPVQPTDDQPDEQIPEPTAQDATTEVALDTETSRPDLVQRIRVNRAYTGFRTSEQTILPGLYYADDPSLFGQAEYLVSQQYAEWAN